jgi:hypothetical protein
MSLSKNKFLYSNNILHFLKRAVPFQDLSEEEKRRKFLEDSEDSDEDPDDPDAVSDEASISDFSEEEAAKK